MSPAGRPPLAGETKDERLMLRLTSAEKMQIDNAAAVMGKPTATWARDELLRLATEATAAKPTTKKAAGTAKKPKA